MTEPMRTPDVPLNWNAASVDLPPIPMIAPGADAMSMTIAGVLPTLTAPLTASVAALSAMEDMFSSKVTSADSAYQNSDQSGGQSVGQLGQMLGQLGQMAQQAGGSGGGGSGIFGSLMEQAMKVTQSGGSADAHPAAGQITTQGQPGTGTPQPQHDRSTDARQNDVSERDDRDRREKDARAARPPVNVAGPGEGSHTAADPAPVGPVEPPRRGDDDLSRRM